MSRHRPTTSMPTPTSYRDYNNHSPRIIVPGLSSYNSTPMQTSYRSRPNITTTTTSSRHRDTPYYTTPSSYNTTQRSSLRPNTAVPRSSLRPNTPRTKSSPIITHSNSSSPREKGLSYTDRRDLGGWLGGAALTAGAAYLLRGGTPKKDSGRYTDDRYEGRGRDRDRDRRYHDDGYARGKIERRGKSERRESGGGRGKRERRDGGRDRERERERRYYY